MAHKFRFPLLLNTLPAARGLDLRRTEAALPRAPAAWQGGQLCGQGPGARARMTFRSQEGRQTRKEVPLPKSRQHRCELREDVSRAAGQGGGRG